MLGARIDALVTLVQMLYMDTVRLRAQGIAVSGAVRSGMAERLGLKPDEGILTFSLVKHTILASDGRVVLPHHRMACWKRACSLGGDAGADRTSFRSSCTDGPAGDGLSWWCP